MWVEKPPPEVVQGLPVDEAPSAPPPEAHDAAKFGSPYCALYLNGVVASGLPWK